MRAALIPDVVLAAVFITLGGMASLQAQELIPCFSCSTSACPTKELPPCPSQQDKQAAERRAAERRAAERRAAEQRAAEQRAAEQRAAEQRAAEQRAAEQRAAEQRAAEQRAAEQRAAEQQGQRPGRDVIVPSVPPPARPAEHSHRLRAAGIGVGVGGVLLAGAGAALLAIDKRYGTECWLPGDPTTCANLYRTQAPGIALLATGGVALVGATILFVRDARQARGGEAKLTLRWSGLTLAR